MNNNIPLPIAKLTPEQYSFHDRSGAPLWRWLMGKKRAERENHYEEVVAEGAMHAHRIKIGHQISMVEKQGAEEVKRFSRQEEIKTAQFISGQHAEAHKDIQGNQLAVAKDITNGYSEINELSKNPNAPEELRIALAQTGKSWIEGYQVIDAACRLSNGHA